MATDAGRRNGDHEPSRVPVVRTRGEVIAMVLDLGGEQEKVRYEQVEALEKDFGWSKVLHYWKIGDYVGDSFKQHDAKTINVYAIGLQRSRQMLRLVVRFKELYTEPQVRELLHDAKAGGHELSWGHFRCLFDERLTDGQRDSLARRAIKHRWGYRELGAVVRVTVSKGSEGIRKPDRVRYPSLASAINAMKRRSRAWLDSEEDWIDQVKQLARKLGAIERRTRAFLDITIAAAIQLRAVARKAGLDADEAEVIAMRAAAAMGIRNFRLDGPAPGGPRIRPRARKKAARPRRLVGDR